MKIKSEIEYEIALARVDTLMDIDPEPDSPEGEELEKLVQAIERYEDQYEDHPREYSRQERSKFYD